MLMVQEEQLPERGLPAFLLTNLKNWKREGQALSATDSYGTWGFWAPEVYYVESKKKFYLFYSAEEHICVANFYYS